MIRALAQDLGVPVEWIRAAILPAVVAFPALLLGLAVWLAR